MKWIITVLLLCAPLKAGDLYSNTLRDFSGGLNTKISENLLPDNQATTADNILFDEGNGFKTRGGITAISSYPVAGKTCQALWSLERSNGEKYFIGSFEDALYYTITKTEWVLIRSGLSWRLNPLQATVYNDKMFFTNGIDYVFYFDGNTYNDKLYGEIELDTIRGKYICSHNNKLFFGNFYDNASKIRYNSDGSDPTLVASYPEANYEFMGYEDGDILMGLHSSRNALIGTKKYSLWGLFGHNYTDWGAPQRINNDYGVFSAQTLQDDKGMVNFLSNKGVIAFNGSSCQKIDMAVEDEFLDCENLKGEYYYWQNTNSVDWNAGTSTGVTLGSQEIYLEDMTKVWNSSNTYPTAFSSGTFSNTKNAGSGVVMKSTYSLSSSLLSYNATPTLTRYFKYASGFNPETEYTIANMTTDGNGWTKGIDTSDFYENYQRINQSDKSEAVRLSEASSLSPPPYGGNVDYFSTRYDGYKAVAVWKNEIPFSGLQYMDKIRIKTGIKVKEGVVNTSNFAVQFPFAIYVEVRVKDKEGISKTIHREKYKDYAGVRVTPSAAPKVTFDFDPAGTLRDEIVLTYDKTLNFAPEYVDTVQVYFIFTPHQNRAHVSAWKYRAIDYGNNSRVTPLYEIEIYTADSLTNAPFISPSTATYITQIHDSGYQVYGSTFTAKVISYLSEGTTIHFKVKTSSWSATLSGETWTDINGAVTEGVQLPTALSPYRYIQVLSSFTTTQSSHTATLQSITVGAIRSSGTWTSKKFNAGKVDKGWKYPVMSAIDNGQTLTYSVKTATGSTALDTVASWDTVTSGVLLDSGLHPSTHTWFREKVYFATTDGRQNPTFESWTQTYCPEAEPIQPASASIEDRYYIAIATTGATNKLTRVYDKRGAWTDIVGWTPVDFCRFGNEWYMAESDGIYKIDGSTTLDNGTAITSRWSKYFDYREQDYDKHLRYVYIVGREGTGTYDFSYQLANSTTVFKITRSQVGNGIFSHRIGIPQHSGVRGFYETISSTSPLEIHAITNVYEREELR